MAMTIAGDYVVKFSGFTHHPSSGRSMNIVGLGKLTLTATSAAGGTAAGYHRSTLNPFTGQNDAKQPRHHTTYDYQNATYTVTDAGPPIVAEVAITFQERGGAGQRMTDTFVAFQTGPDRFSLISKDPKDSSGGLVDEVVMGEAIKVTNTW